MVKTLIEYDGVRLCEQQTWDKIEASANYPFPTSCAEIIKIGFLWVCTGNSGQGFLALSPWCGGSRRFSATTHPPTNRSNAMG